MIKIFKNILFSLMIILFFTLFIQIISESESQYISTAKRVNIDNIISDGITKDEYKILQTQTGLGKSAINDILKKENSKEILKNFQNQNFKEYDILCNYICFPVTKYESLADDTDNRISLNLPEIKKGDILITKSTHTLAFRHGHAGIVTDEMGEVLEALEIGTNSSYGRLDSWRSYPTLAVLRPVNLSDDDIDKVVEFAKKNLYDVEYDLTAGLFGDNFNEKNKVEKTHCSHLVWCAYKSIGIDIDGNGGKLVLPEDILKSDKLETIWSYGINATK